LAAPFLSEADKAAAAGQLQKLLVMTDSGSIWLGQRAIAYAKAHPDDPDVPEVLFLTVRATHFGCSTPEVEAKRLETAKTAFQLLKTKYGNSKWAKMTRYYS
jgi:hypothetical protein